MSNTTISGSVLGQHVSLEDGTIVGLIMHVNDDFSSDGPAENSYIYLDIVDRSGTPRGRYISWINLYDIEHAEKVEPGCWELVEPDTSFSESINWFPYGWGDTEFPSVADVDH